MPVDLDKAAAMKPWDLAAEKAWWEPFESASDRGRYITLLTMMPFLNGDQVRELVDIGTRAGKFGADIVLDLAAFSNPPMTLPDFFTARSRA